MPRSPKPLLLPALIMIRKINLEVMSLGFAPGYENFELDEIEKAMTPIAWNLANRLKDMVLPSRM